MMSSKGPVFRMAAKTPSAGLAGLVRFLFYSYGHEMLHASSFLFNR